MRPSINTLRQTASLVVVAALTITVLPLHVEAFMPTVDATKTTHSEGSASHESITHDAIEDYDKDFFALGNKPLSKNMKIAIGEIIDGNAAVDDSSGDQYLKSSSHFDGEAFQESQQRLIDYKQKVIDLVNPIRQGAKPNLSRARFYLGQALHTLQDFYSHSNWVELGNTDPYSVLGMPGNPLANPAASTATCTNCARNSCTDCYNPNTGLTNLTGTTLTTGYYVFEGCLGGLCTTTPEDHLKPNDLKCSHGGKVLVGPFNAASGRDVSGKGAISSGINKDTKVCQISPHYDKHPTAARVAKASTMGYLDDLKKRLGIPKMKVLLGGGPIWAIAIDTTGSMSGIIAQVKDQAIQIIDSRLNTDEEPSQYVLAPFNDPDVGPVTVTDNPTEFKNAIRNLSVGGGGDCPEFANTGMLQALDNLSEGDELLMFTDASSKDGYLAGLLESQAVAKGVKISPITFGSCSPLDPAFIRVANATGGQVFQLDRSEAGSITRLADFVLRSRAVDLLSINDTLAAAKTYSVPIDSTMTAVTFAVSGATDVVVRRPNGSQVQPDLDVQYVPVSGGRIYSIANPVTGSWSVTIGTPADISLRVSGESSLDFSYFRFVRLSDLAPHPGFFPRTGLPQVNETATVEAQLSAEAATVNFDLRTPSGAALQQVSATEIGWANESPDEESFTIGPVRKFITDISTPSVPFRAYASGQDANGFPYQRVVTGTTKPQTIRVSAPMAQELIPGQTTTYTFTVTNFGSPDTFTLSGADDNGFLSGVSPTSLTLGTNETQDVTVTLTPPADAGDKALDTLTLVAESTIASQAFNYATVQSLVKSTSHLAFDSFTATEVGGDGDNVIESGEGGSISVQLDNTGDTAISGIQATLTTTTPGVTVNSGSASFPNIGPADIGVNSTPFTFSLDNRTFGLSVDFTLTVTYAGATQPLEIKLSVPVGGVPPAQIAFSTFRDGNQEIYRIKADGDELVNLTNDPSDDSSPVASPDRSKIAFISRRDGNPRIYVMNANGSNPRAVTQNTNDLAYTSPFSWSPDESKLAFARFDNGVPQISVINIDGSNLLTLTSSDGDKSSPTWSPDGTKIAFTRKSDFNNTIQRYNMDLYVMNADGSNQTQLTSGLANSEPSWSPNGTVIAFAALGPYTSTFERNTSEIRLINADGSNLRQLTTSTRSNNPAWSPDGTKIAFASYRSSNFNFDIFVMNADGTNQVNLTNDLLGTFQSGFPPDDEQPAWSPEGTQIAFTRLGTEVHVMNIDGTANLVLIQGQFTVRFPTWIRPGASTPPTNPVPSVLSTDGRVIAAGSSTVLTATLKDSSGVPISNRSVNITLGSGAGAQSCNALTDSNGVAACTISNVSQPLGPGAVSADFAGDDNYLASTANAPTLIFAYLSVSGGGSFVIGDLNSGVGQSVTFWGSQWSGANHLSSGSAPSSFKGFANSLSSSPMSCGGTWSSRPGNSSSPPSSVPSYMAVIVSSSVTKSGSTISGNAPRIVVVKTDAGYSGNPGHAGTGTITGVFCP